MEFASSEPVPSQSVALERASSAASLEQAPQPAAAGGPAAPRAVSLDGLIGSRRLWRGQGAQAAPSAQPTGHAALDAALPTGGWPEAALSELLLPHAGVGELELLWPALARLSREAPGHEAGMIVLVDPPLLPYAPAWRDAGVALSRLQVVRASGRDALWAAEQCLRSGACAAVLCWPQRADDRALRRLQVAAESGQCLGFAVREARAALNPSPAALRIAIDAAPRQLRVLKCRGGNAPTRPIAFGHSDARDVEATPVLAHDLERGAEVIRLPPQLRPVRFIAAIGADSVGTEVPPTRAASAAVGGTSVPTLSAQPPRTLPAPQR
ncbi:hypothetical protein GLE_2206 [Lysobacter enzymogenes]|uniref:Translesion DNA synthesis-associated protein ImuA n=1 Tax=Lysobacter enzymogenes TaxID=69 RepID=A0A0S2DGM5_LYSEN|nr:hypothetical protein GLE_2206 [Lysobacter enzymogenes]